MRAAGSPFALAAQDKSEKLPLKTGKYAPKSAKKTPFLRHLTLFSRFFVRFFYDIYPK
jgi:hypothetical protein